MTRAEQIAAAFHEAYERLAPRYGYVTRDETAVPWARMPEPNRSLMVATIELLLHNDIIRTGATYEPTS